jgi:hypothetical protein
MEPKRLASDEDLSGFSAGFDSMLRELFGEYIQKLALRATWPEYFGHLTDAMLAKESWAGMEARLHWELLYGDGFSVKDGNGPNGSIRKAESAKKVVAWAARSVA